MVTQIFKANPNPRDQKLLLAWHIVSQYFDNKTADNSKAAFISQFSKKQLPSDIKEINIKPNSYEIVDLLVISGLVKSKSEARRLIAQGGVRINQEVVKDGVIVVKSKNNILLQVGKRNFIKIK